MMLEAADEPQQYKLMPHEFHAMDSKKRGGFDFSLNITRNKATNNIKGSEAAIDLLNMLQLSRKGSELLDSYSYEIVLDKQFILHISQIKTEIESI